MCPKSDEGGGKAGDSRELQFESIGKLLYSWEKLKLQIKSEGSFLEGSCSGEVSLLLCLGLN